MSVPEIALLLKAERTETPEGAVWLCDCPSCGTKEGLCVKADGDVICLNEPLCHRDEIIRAAERLRDGMAQFDCLPNGVKPKIPLPVDTQNADGREKAGGKKKSVACLTRLSEIEPEIIDWLWERRVPYGALTLFLGDPGQGKSTLVLTLAARVSRGQGMPDSPLSVVAADVILICPEDSAAATIRGRLEAAGADLTRIHLLEFKETFDNGKTYPRPPVIPDDLPALHEKITETGAKLVIFDPLNSILSPGLNAYRGPDVRQALAPAAQIAQDTKAAFVIVHHMNKGSGTSAIHRSGGSIDIMGVVRSALLVAADPDKPEGRVIAPAKNNLSKFAASLSFSLVESGDVARIQWEGESNHTASDLLAAAGTPEADGGASASADAEEFIRSVLADGPVAVASVQTEAKNAGIKDITLRRVKEKIGVVWKREGFGPGATVTWQLPEKPAGEHTCS